jgi:hypothetical protein
VATTIPAGSGGVRDFGSRETASGDQELYDCA